MRRLPKAGQLEQLALALVFGLIVAGLALLAPVAGRHLGQPAPSPTPTVGSSPTPPPAAVLLKSELEQALEGVVTVVNDHTFGTAFVIDPQGNLLTAASLVAGSTSLRLVDNSGGSHPVRVIGVDELNGIAQIRAENGGLPMPFGDPASLHKDDPLVLLASPKIANLRTATPAVVTETSGSSVALRVDDLPGNIGGPLVGPGGKVLALFSRSGLARSITAAQPTIAQWRNQPGTLLPLAPLPATLVLRGTDTTSSPVSGPTLQAISPTRASAAQAALITLQGAGFVGGPSLRVRFIPVASPNGGFDGLAPTLLSGAALTVKVPAGRIVQDYVVQLTNGDGTLTSSRTAFTVTP